MKIGERTTNPGELRTLVQFQTPTISVDAGGAQSVTWALLDEVYVKWVNAHGVEILTSDALKTVRRATVTRRYNSGVSERTSLLKDSDRWQVVSVDDIQNRHEYMELVVELAKGSI